MDEKLKEAIEDGLKSFISDTHDFTMSQAMRSSAADHIMAQPGTMANHVLYSGRKVTRLIVEWLRTGDIGNADYAEAARALADAIERGDHL